MTPACRITFSTKALLLPDKPPLGALFTYNDPDLEVLITFNEDMDTSQTPAAALFGISVQGVNKTPDGVAWRLPRALQLSYSEIGLGVASVIANFPQHDTSFRFATGEMQGSFTVDAAQQLFSGVYEFDVPDFTIVLTCNLSLDQTLGNSPDGYRVEFDSDNVDLDDAWIDTEFTIKVTATIGGDPDEPVDMWFAGPRSKMRDLLGRYLLSFSLADLEEDT